jgi:lysophospholipase L1-like esterase
MKRIIVSFLLALSLFAVAAECQLAEEFRPPRANCCLQNTAQSLADQLQDWNQFGRYQADNETLKAQGPVAGRVVFLGDSITDGWRLADYFPGKPYVNRGISGQTTPQMLARFYRDVINLQPAAVIILAGTNDIARNTGPQTAEMIQDNFRAINELAQAHKIKVILCALTPVSDYGKVRQTERRPPSDVLKLNAWLREYAAEVDAVYADYYTALVDDKGFLRQGLSQDGLHPNPQGYELMVPIAAAAIEKALQ